MADASEQYNALEKRIVKAQKKLRKQNRSHSLLSLVEVDKRGIHYTGEFGGRYKGMPAYEGLRRYAGELEQALKD